MKKFKQNVGLLFLYAILLSGCGSASEKLDNPRRGTITIAADESLKPLVFALTNGYEGIYPDAHFKIDYKPEQETVLQLLQDSARLAFITRQLNDKEKSIIKQQKGAQKAQHIATDGLAVIVGKQNTDSLITLPELRSIFEGKITNWSQLQGSNQTGLITLVFDNINSSNLNFVLDKFGITDLTKLRIVSAGSNENVISQVKENPLLMGFIGASWVSDGHSLKSEELSKGLTVFGISKTATPASVKEYYQPFQSGLEFKNYPLSREIYIISREGYSGLGGGLMTYIARDVGGLIIEKLGLVPRIRYPRELEVRTSGEL
jgi:phosphate transport system substrate-binding protein